MSAAELFAVVMAFLALLYSLAWLLAWALISVTRTIVGAIAEPLALNVERADSDDEPFKAAA